MKCITYKRVSTPNQSDNYSIEKQREDGTIFCQKNGWEEVSYEDVKSGNDVTRNGWQQLLQDVRTGKAEAIWVGAVDRFSRNTRDGLEAVDLLRKHKIRFFIAGIEYDIFNETTYLLITMQFAIGQLERATIKNRLTSGIIKSYDSGNRKINSVLGYDGYYDEKGNRCIRINEDEAELVRYIFRLFIEEKESYSAIARLVNDSGFKAKRAGKLLNYKGTMRVMETHWQASHIKNIVKRPEYAGLVWNYDKTKLLESNHFEAIIERAEWQKAQDRSNDISIPAKDGYRITEHPASGIIKCGKCGATYFWTEYKRSYGIHRYYRHKIETKINKDCDNRPKCVDADFIESVLAVLYINTFSDTQELRKLKEKFADSIRKDEDELQADKKRIGERISDVEKKLKNLIALAEEVNDISEVADRIKQLRIERGQWEEKLKEAEELYIQKTTKYSEIFDAFTEKSLGDFFSSQQYDRRVVYLKAINSAVMLDSKLTIEFITGRTITIDVKNRPAWLNAQIANWKAGVYTIDWINARRNSIEAFHQEIDDEWKDNSTL